MAEVLRSCGRERWCLATNSMCKYDERLRLHRFATDWTIMEFLLEMTPGTGWLACENRRIVYLPGAESVDVAHDVIEPLLVPRDIESAFRTFRNWLETGRPLPAMMLIGLDGTAQAMANQIDGVAAVDAGGSESRVVSLTDGAFGPTALGSVKTLGMNDRQTEPSGMLVEGVIRAGGFRLHIHTGATARHTGEAPSVSWPNESLQLHLDEYSVDVGRGIVVGRWPYKHADFDSALEPLILADPAVSRLHAEIRPEGSGAVVVDKGSHNGTWVRPAGSADRVTMQANVPFVIQSGDQVIMGDTTMTLGGAGAD